MKFTRLATVAALSLTMLSACSENDDGNPSSTVLPAQAAEGSATIVDTAVEAGSFTTLVAALQATGLDEALADESREFTVFAPTDDAFAELGQETIDALLADTDTLRDILLYHVLPDQNVDSATAISLAGSSVEAANGDNLNISLDGLRLFINDSEVTTPDVGATNGVIHVVNKVLIPPTDAPADDAPLANIVDTAVGAGSFNTLAAALEATDLIGVLADESATFTVFAPTDEAFAALGQDTIDALLADPDTLRDILLYHVVPNAAVDANTAISLAGSTVTMANGDDTAVTLDGGQLRINQANVVATDVFASNGIIHVLDAVLLPPADEPADAPLANIVDTAVAAGSFNTLVAALQATGLDSVLADESATFTVFAPTDDAFALLGEDTINALLGDTDTLSGILTYHVIGGAAVDSTTALSLAGTSVPTVNGAEVFISVDGDRLLVNMSEVIVADVRASNGIIHVIDAVLLPPVTEDPVTSEPLPNLLDAARNAGNLNTFVAALEATGLDVAIGHGNDMYTVFAPTDEAFAALGQDTINALLNDTDTLRDILLYHVIAGTAVDAQTAIAKVGIEIEAANGDRFVLNLRGDALYINDSQIIGTDLFASNGIIHTIDAVLIPPSHGN